MILFENSKYEKIIDELDYIESRFVNYLKKAGEFAPKVESLEGSNKVLILENSNLKIKVLELESKIEGLNNEIEKFRNARNLIKTEDKEGIKDQIDEIISKIDEYLSS